VKKPRTAVHGVKPVMTNAQRRRATGHFGNAAFVHHLGMRITKLAAGEAVVSMPIADALKQYQGLAHGGALASLADTAATRAALMALPADSDVVTIEFKMNYLSSLRAGRAVARAKLVRLGSRVVVVDVSVASMPGGKLASTGFVYHVAIPGSSALEHRTIWNPVRRRVMPV
jgi:uncharacterized protein (TIGR00369 family)